MCYPVVNSLFLRSSGKSVCPLSSVLWPLRGWEMQWKVSPFTDISLHLFQVILKVVYDVYECTVYTNIFIIILSDFSFTVLM